MAGIMFMVIMLALIALALEGDWFEKHQSEFIEEERRDK